MITKHYEFSVWLRITHWLRALAIVILTATGFYIAYPFLSPAQSGGEPVNFLYALARMWHIVFGFFINCSNNLVNFIYFSLIRKVKMKECLFGILLILKFGINKSSITC